MPGCFRSSVKEITIERKRLCLLIVVLKPLQMPEATASTKPYGWHVCPLPGRLSYSVNAAGGHCWGPSSRTSSTDYWARTHQTQTGVTSASVAQHRVIIDLSLGLSGSQERTRSVIQEAEHLISRSPGLDSSTSLN